MRVAQSVKLLIPPYLKNLVYTHEITMCEHERVQLIGICEEEVGALGMGTKTQPKVTFRWHRCGKGWWLNVAIC